MDSPHTKKKHKPKSIFLYFSFFLFFIFFFCSSNHSFYSSLPSSPITLPIPLHVHHRILFPDHLLLMLSNPKIIPSTQLHCVYHHTLLNASSNPLLLPLLSTDRYDEFRSIARCPLPPTNFSAVDLTWRRQVNHRDVQFPVRAKPHNWEKLAYEAFLDNNTVVVFVKGLNLRPHRVSDATLYQCHFGLPNGAFRLTAKAVSAAQEVVRCALPQSIWNSPDKGRGISVSVSDVRGGGVIPSVARIGRFEKQGRVKVKEKKFELCACTMVWNQAGALREWVMYHAWVGVERWFIYDNNSDDEIEAVVRELEEEGYNISRVTWPWVKSQEAGFSHCVLKAKEECKWVGLYDVDEFFYLNQMQQRNGLRSIVANFSSWNNSVAEIRTGCHSFGASGLTTHPKRGVGVGYTCRLRSPERHKSMVRPDLVDLSLLNVVHHFEVREGFESRNLPLSVAVINHYKYQVWERFKMKFLRRVATYVVDWKEEVNIGSKDRAPGLGTQPIEPPDWRFRFCEIWDTRLKDFLLSNFSNPQTSLLPWETSSQ
ncbi:hypothetical protein PHAVU_003G072900 [Phaseolus vulgaris]|uniref:Glycosyltransferase family 92 protein n=1 Tax=Phaseolus vulgaris TaxID=3885 RepID=V7C6T0_PHAVU|nr:hypothetical protein PHAVU_003G072900g [Phaseolus vulgaris]ESW25877.1 hypothetical protein PHAVU_003G072900g [Phaseolus vulgaris]